jgi:hypothetical protein
MRFFNRKTEPAGKGTEQLAAHIAAQIIRWQVAIASKINARANRYSKPAQRKLLWLFCAAWLAAVCFNFFYAQNKRTIRAARPNFLPAHIGQASDLPRAIPKPIAKTDSLILKK